MRLRQLRPPSGWPLHRLVRAIGSVLFLATFAQEVLKPPEQRTWHGRCSACSPMTTGRCDLVRRLTAAFWNPHDHHLFTPRPMGMGWVVNVYEVRRRLSGR